MAYKFNPLSGNLDYYPANSDIDHNALTNYVANEHIDWTNATSNLVTTGTLGAGAIKSSVGSALLPAYSFADDPDTGFFWKSSNAIGISAGGTEVMYIAATSMGATVNFRVGDGSVSWPALAFTSDSNTGFYKTASDQIGITCGGVLAINFGSIAISSMTPMGFPTATNTRPSFFHSGDPNTGINFSANYQFDFVSGGVTQMSVNQTDISMTSPLSIAVTTEQLRVGYNATNYFSTTVGSTGVVTFDAVGTGALFAFSDVVKAAGYQSSDGSVGVTGSFTTADSKTVTVKNGLIVSIA